MSDIEIEIDGKKLQAKPNAMVIQVADEAGIYIPRFCYHKQLSVAANCRMCLVEVEKSPKPLPACATPVMPGMKIFTRSAKAIAAQKAVMEFLLINHPLDCPICDQGGECELQDLSMGYGAAESNFCEGKRSVADEDIGPLVATEMTRCIQCTRCVRFGAEVAGFPELGALGRGENLEIGTYIQSALHSEVSGNIIDLCPVGALTSKPYRFTARPWELQQFPSIAPHDCWGSNINVHTRRGRVMRVVPRENMSINQMWLSDRDRFSYEGLYHADRLTKPLVRFGEKWQEVDWQSALDCAVEALQRVLNTQGADQVAALASPNSTLEEFYLLQKLMRSIGSSHIDHRLRQVDFRDQQRMPFFPGLSHPISALDEYEHIILIGSDITREQPLASLRLRDAVKKGAEVSVINMLNYTFNFKVANAFIVAPQHFVTALKNYSVPFKSQKKTCILLGAQALNHPEASLIRAYAYRLGDQLQASVGLLTEGANSAGGWIAGALPHRGPAGAHVREGLDAFKIWEVQHKAYLLLNVEPDLDCANSFQAIQALEQADCVIALSLFSNPVLLNTATVILPIAAFTETAGTFVNAEGEWQTFKGVVSPFEEARPAWKVLRVLANFLKCQGFEYRSAEEVRRELWEKVNEMNEPDLSHYKIANVSAEIDTESQLLSPLQHPKIHRIGEVPIYSGDSVVRRAKALQATQHIIQGDLNAARLNPQTAEALHLKDEMSIIVKQNDLSLRVPVILDANVPEDAVYLATGIPSTQGLSSLFGPVEIQKA